jgi:hypothetical protein
MKPDTAVGQVHVERGYVWELDAGTSVSALVVPRLVFRIALAVHDRASHSKGLSALATHVSRTRSFTSL